MYQYALFTRPAWPLKSHVTVVAEHLISPDVDYSSMKSSPVIILDAMDLSAYHKEFVGFEFISSWC